MSEITECQIIFRRDEIIIKKIENLPLVGKKEIVEKIDYSQLEGKRLELTIKSVRRLRSNGDWELVFDVASLREGTGFMLFVLLLWLGMWIGLFECYGINPMYGLVVGLLTFVLTVWVRKRVAGRIWR